MKLVKESLHEFQQGGNPLVKMGLGSITKIHNWFKEWAPDVKYDIDNDLNIIVKDFLDLYGTTVTWLPDNLTINGYLDLTNTPITHLPNNLIVNGDLWINHTKITHLPNNLRVKDKIFKDF